MEEKSSEIKEVAADLSILGITVKLHSEDLPESEERVDMLSFFKKIGDRTAYYTVQYNYLTMKPHVSAAIRRFREMEDE